MNAEVSTLRNILEDRRQFRVPLYQRKYVWREKPHWEDLWNDLIDLCRHKNPQNHFIGTMVTAPGKAIGVGVISINLIDGQQRLMTLFVLLALLLRNKTRLASKWLTNELKMGEDEEKRQKLIPTSHDMKAYNNIMDGNKDFLDDSSSLIAAYHYFEQRLKRSPKHIKKRLLKAVIDKLFFVYVTLDYEDNQSRVFATLNGNEAPLSEIDLIRNHVYTILDDEKLYYQYWSPLEETLGEERIVEEFIRHFLMKEASYVKIKDISHTFFERVRNKKDDKKKFIGYLRDIRKFAGFYSKVRSLSDSQKSPSSLSRRFQDLRKTQISDLYPFLLLSYDYYSSHKLTEEQLSAIIQTIENFLIRRFVCHKRSNLSEICSQLCFKISEDIKKTVTDIRMYLSDRDYPSDAEFKEMFMRSKLYSSSPTSLRLILERIEQSYNNPELGDLTNYSIEHIMPQQLNDGWLSDLGESYKDHYERWVDTLGNLTLIQSNSKLGNQIFREKKKILIGSSLALNKYFHDIDSWTFDKIQQRAESLGETAIGIWPDLSTQRSRVSSFPKFLKDPPPDIDFMGKNYTIENNHDIQEIVLEYIIKTHPDKIKEIDQSPIVISKDKLYSKHRGSRILSNGYYMEIKSSLPRMMRNCDRCLQLVGVNKLADVLILNYPE